MFVVRHKAAFVIHHLVRQAAGLAAFAPVGAASGVRGRNVALAAVGHTQCAVHKKLDDAAAGVGGSADGGHLLQVEFTRQHDLAQAHVLQKTRFLGCADVTLGAGVQLDRRQVKLQQAHVLDDQCIHPRVIELPGQLAGALQFVVTQNGVEGDKNAAVETVRVLHQLRDVADAVVGAGTRAKRWPTDVDRVGTVVDGFDANGDITCRG
ncbi:hypothetical protein GALL_442510 [mine drainage metagenome]|uniref:Uncharacterized protein n=1 Tax=mine drainage metagenome TaxID=410659 RepID=A0A1J5QDT3_9ZZZZ